ncbi:MAG: hypothetical protein ACPIOQ_58600, partial [Promethearchaeia archaeon]
MPRPGAQQGGAFSQIFDLRAYSGLPAWRAREQASFKLRHPPTPTLVVVQRSSNLAYLQRR